MNASTFALIQGLHANLVSRADAIRAAEQNEREVVASRRASGVATLAAAFAALDDKPSPLAQPGETTDNTEESDYGR